MSLSSEEMALIDLRFHPRARKITLKASTIKGLILTAPPSISLETCKEFLNDNASWIREQISLIQVKNQEKVFDFNTQFSTFYRNVHLVETDISELRYRLTDTKLSIYVSANDILKRSSQKQIKEIIIDTLRLEAKHYLPIRLKELADKQNLKYQKLTVKNLKSVWGSCSYTNNINLSLHLMRLPTELIDYVIWHELTHTIEKNHSKRFWDKLENFLPGAKDLDRQLKNYHPQDL